MQLSRSAALTRAVAVAVTVAATVAAMAGCTARARASAPAFTCAASSTDRQECVLALDDSSAIPARVRVISSLSDTTAGAPGIHVFLDDGHGGWQPLPRFYGDSVWSGCSLVTADNGAPRSDRIAIADVDGDGRRDVVVVGACMTGIGANAAEPFAVGTIYLQTSPQHFAVDAARDSAFSDALPSTCAENACDVLGAVRKTLHR